MRRKFPLTFARCHLVLALASLAVLLPHIWLLPPARNLEGKIPLSCSAAIWVAVTVFRRMRRIKSRARVEGILDHDRVLVNAANQKDTEGADDLKQTTATWMKAELPRNVRIYPGAYFYVFFREMPFWRRHRAVPLMAFSWEPLLPEKLQRYPKHASKKQLQDRSSNEDCDHATNLTFLILNTPSLSKLLTKNSPIILDGPYGPNIKLDRFDTVVLTAKGIGIAGVLPFILHLAYRKHYDQEQKRSMKERMKEGIKWRSEGEGRGRYGEPSPKQFAPLKLDRTRRITLLWVLEDSSQINWASQQLRALAGFDTRRVRLPGIAACTPLTLEHLGVSTCLDLRTDHVQRPTGRPA